MQSPKSSRPHAPGEKPSEDGNPYHESGGQTKPQGPPARGPQVPDLNFGKAGHQGGVQSGERHVPTHPAAPDRAGSPGYVSSDDAKRTGGTVERFANDRGGNS